MPAYLNKTAQILLNSYDVPDPGDIRGRDNTQAAFSLVAHREVHGQLQSSKVSAETGRGEAATGLWVAQGGEASRGQDVKCNIGHINNLTLT